MKMAHQRPPPPDGFLNKSVRIANQGVQLMGTMKGLWEMGRFAVNAGRAIAPALALL
jgi:hypothetical protein